MSLTFFQKCSVYKTSFDFRENDLAYTFDTSRRKAGASIAYDKIGNKTCYIKRKMWALKYLGVFYVMLWLITGIRWVYFAGHLPNAGGVIAGLFTVGVMLIGMCGVFYIYRPVGITQILGVDPGLFILEDVQQQAIFDEIWKRRKEHIRRKMAQVDFDNPFYEEARKFKWLKDENIISEQEYIQARQKISAMKDKSSLSSPADTSHIN